MGKRSGSRPAPGLAKILSGSSYRAETESERIEREHDEARQRLEAEGIMAGLTPMAKKRIIALTRARGMNRATRRATGAIIRADIAKQGRDSARNQRRREAKEEREVELWLRYEARAARGVTGPIWSHSEEEQRRIMGLYGRVDSVVIDGEEVQNAGGVLVRVTSDTHA